MYDGGLYMQQVQGERMTDQGNMFDTEVEEARQEKVALDEDAQNALDFPVEKCEERVKADGSLWDMRNWENNHDRAEVLAMLEKHSDDLSYAGEHWGHVNFCMDIAHRSHGVPLETLADWIMANDKISFQYRIVQCGPDATRCHKFVEQGHFGRRMCEPCEYTPKQLKKRASDNATAWIGRIEQLKKFMVDDGVNDVSAIQIPQELIDATN